MRTPKILRRLLGLPEEPPPAPPPPPVAGPTPETPATLERPDD